MLARGLLCDLFPTCLGFSSDLVSNLLHNENLDHLCHFVDPVRVGQLCDHDDYLQQDYPCAWRSHEHKGQFDLRLHALQAHRLLHAGRQTLTKLQGGHEHGC